VGKKKYRKTFPKKEPTAAAQRGVEGGTAGGELVPEKNSAHKAKKTRSCKHGSGGAGAKEKLTSVRTKNSFDGDKRRKRSRRITGYIRENQKSQVKKGGAGPCGNYIPMGRKRAVKCLARRAKQKRECEPIKSWSKDIGNTQLSEKTKCWLMGGGPTGRTKKYATAGIYCDPPHHEIKLKNEWWSTIVREMVLAPQGQAVQGGD